MPEIDDTVEINIDMKDVQVDTYRASGAGGQHINKTDSAVRMTHRPTGIVVQCQSQRSQMQNREQALRLLRAKLFELELEKQAELKEQIGGTYQAIEWGSQIRSYVFHPYNLVKDHRTGVETGNVQSVMDGNLDQFMEGFLKKEANLTVLGVLMKSFYYSYLVLIIALAAATQFLLPSYISSRIEKQLNDSLKPSAQTVNVESQPGFKLLYGEADHVYGSLDDVNLVN